MNKITDDDWEIFIAGVLVGFFFGVFIATTPASGDPAYMDHPLTIPPLTIPTSLVY